MRNYDFNEKLDWKSFQILACEIVQYREKIHFQTFRDGKDKGIDGLWFWEEKNIVLQAKRYKKFADLYRVLKDDELPKIKNLDPKRYILVVSLSLSEQEAEKIYELFSGYITRSDDLLDRDALNRFLSEPSYHWIEKNFTNLWIPDGIILEEVMQKIMKKGAKNRNAREQRKAIEGCRTFVQTGVYNKARERMEKNHVVVISGQPGMGKTTIARMLALDFLSFDCHEGFHWVSSLDEIEYEWEESEQKQVFILDDYWGAVFHRERSRKDNYILEELIDKFRITDGKCLIITTREYIVQQELFLNPELQDIIQTLKIECVMKEYSDAEKVKILFAHLQASDLDIEYVESIYHNCDRLVYNHGYSPRVIDKFLKQPGYEEYSPWEYAQNLLDWIEHPELMWKGVFAELSEEAIMISSIVAISYTPISIEDVRNTYSNYVQIYKGDSVPKSFESCISELEETILLTYYDEEEEETKMEFENPSIVDFLLEYLDKNQEYYIPRLTKCSIFYNQLLMLLEKFHCHDKKINQMVEKRCVEEFYKLPMKLEDYGVREFGESFRDSGSEWCRRAFHLMRLTQYGSGDQAWDFIREFVKQFFTCIEKHSLFNGVQEMMNFAGLIEVCEKKGMHFDGKEVIEQYWEHCRLYQDYQGMEKLLNVYPKLSAEWGEKYAAFMKTHVKKLILETLLYYDEYGYDIEEDILVELIPSILKDFGLNYTKKYKNEIKDIVGYYYEDPRPLKMNAGRSQSSPSIEEMDYDQAKREGYEQLLGESDFYLEENMIEIIKIHCFAEENENFLLRTIKTGEPWYLHEFMVDESSIDLLKQLEDKLLLKMAVEDLYLFTFWIFYAITAELGELCGNLIRFCVDYALEMLNKTVPIISESKFKKLPCYKEFVEHNPEVETLLFTYLLGRRSKWVVIKQDVLILCLLFRGMKDDAEVDWDTVFDKGRGTCLVGGQKGKKIFCFPDFVNHSNMKWIQKIQMIMDEIDKKGFRQRHVIPKLEEFLNRYHQKPERAVAFMEDIQWRLDIDINGKLCGSFAVEDDVMILAENIGIADLCDAEERLSGSSLKSLIKRKEICSEKEGHITVFVYKEKDKKYLKRIGVYDALESCRNCFWGVSKHKLRYT